jgi:hypothetical protein
MIESPSIDGNDWSRVNTRIDSGHHGTFCRRRINIHIHRLLVALIASHVVVPI